MIMIMETPWCHDNKGKVLTMEDVSGTTAPKSQQGNTSLLWKKNKNIKRNK
jgi:hypothetical protein